MVYNQVLNNKKDIVNINGEICTHIILNNVIINENTDIEFKNNSDLLPFNGKDVFLLFQYLRKFKPELKYFVALWDSDDEKKKLVKIASNYSKSKVFLDNFINFIKKYNLINAIDYSILFGETDDENMKFHLNKLKMKFKEKIDFENLLSATSYPNDFLSKICNDIKVLKLL